MNKSEASAFLVGQGWTKADATRALETIDFGTNPDELTIFKAIALFAGTQLIERQRSQAAQKGIVTKKTKEIEKLQAEIKDFTEEDKDLAEKINFLLAENKELFRANELLKKDKQQAEIKDFTEKNKDLAEKINFLLAENKELFRANELPKKDNKQAEIRDFTEKNKDLVERIRVLFAENQELVKANDILKKDNKHLKNIVDFIKLKLTKNIKEILKHKDSEIRDAVIKFFNGTLG